MVMSLAVIPLLMHRPPAINIRWWIQLIGHIPFVGIPIVASIGRGALGPSTLAASITTFAIHGFMLIMHS
jgi:hypothetical protein